MNNAQLLSLPTAQQILLWSFFFSQGNGETQQYYFRAISMLHPTWRLTNADRLTLTNTFPMITALIARGAHTPLSEEDSAEEEFNQQSTVMQTELANGHAYPSEEWEKTIARILSSMISQDYYFLVQKNGRKRPQTSSSTPPMRQDPYLSFFCHFLLLGHRTHCDSFDKLLVKLAQAFEQRGTTYHAIWHLEDWHPKARPNMVEQIIEQHNRFHPQHQVAPFSPSLPPPVQTRS